MQKIHKTTLGKLGFIARGATGPWRAMPDFLIIGAQKAATTSLFRYILQHPDVAPPYRKEIHYFAHKYAEGLNWYRAHFPLKVAKGRRVTGEASTSYLFTPGVAERVKAEAPDVRLIVILRDPVARALSQHQHNVHNGHYSMTFAEAIQREAAHDWAAETNAAKIRRERLAARGFYVEQIERWLAHFPRERFAFVKYERFIADPNAELARIFGFLGLAPFQADASRRYKSRGARETIDAETAAYLRARFAEANARLPALIGPEFAWE
ncbi:MAG: sulfotransferase [Hyphomicrobiales bacterium]|nr:sulfotransferase [Hyphomicrobiales bacterium]